MARADHKLINVTEQITSGIWPSVDPLRVPLWINGANVQFTPTGVKKMGGWSAPFTELGSTPIRGMHQLQDSSGVQMLYFGDQTKLYRWNTTTVVDRGGVYTGNLNETVTAPASTWSIDNLGDIVLATNGVDQPQLDTGTGFGNLGADFTTAEIFLRWGPHLLAFNTSINPRGAVWADEDKYLAADWTPTSSNAAGDIIFREATSQIIAAVPLGNRIAVYTKDQMFVMSYIQAPFYFGYQPAEEGVGAVSKKSIIAVGSQNYGLGRMGLFVTDGVQHQFIDDPSIREFLQDDISWAQATKINGWHDEDNHQVIWYYPSVGGAGEPDKGIAYDYKKGVFSIFDFGRTSSMDRDVYTYPIAATNGGEVFYHNFGNDANGAALTAWIRSTDLALGEPDRFKEFTFLRTSWSGTGLKYRLGKRLSLNAAITWGSYIAVPAGNAHKSIRHNSPYPSIEYYSNQIGDNWEITSFTVYGQMIGER